MVAIYRSLSLCWRCSISNSSAITLRFNFPTWRRKCWTSSLGGRDTSRALKGVCSLYKSMTQDTIFCKRFYSNVKNSVPDVSRYLRFCIICSRCCIQWFHNFNGMCRRIILVHCWEVVIVQSQNSRRCLLIRRSLMTNHQSVIYLNILPALWL